MITFMLRSVYSHENSGCCYRVGEMVGPRTGPDAVGGQKNPAPSDNSALTNANLVTSMPV